MFAYFKFLKRVKSKIISGIVFLIFISCVILSVAKAKFPLALVTIYTSFILIMLMAIKSSFFAQNTKLLELSGNISYISLLFLFPVKRKNIISLEFISDAIIILIYLVFLNAGMLILKVFNLIESYNIFLSFFLPFSFILTWLSICSILYSFIYFTKNSALQTFLNVLANIIAIMLGYIPISALFLSDSHKRVERFLTNLYTNPENTFIFLLVSTVLFLTSFVVNKVAIYRREI